MASDVYQRTFIILVYSEMPWHLPGQSLGNLIYDLARTARPRDRADRQVGKFEIEIGESHRCGGDPISEMGGIAKPYTRTSPHLFTNVTPP